MRPNVINRCVLSALRRLGVLRWVNFSVHVKNPVEIHFPIRGGVGAEHFSWTPHEPRMEKVLRVLLAVKTGAFVDVGVNIGQTLVAFLKARRDHAYFGFEPNPACCAYIRTLLYINNFRDTCIIPVAMSDHNGLARLFVGASTNSSASLVEGFRKETDHTVFQYVPMRLGDEVIQELGVTAISVLKIDVEGAELDVLRGLANTINRFSPFILCEILPVYDEATEIGRMRRSRTDGVVSFLQGQGYRFARVSHDGKTAPLTDIETHGDLEKCDYIFIPESLVETVNDAGISVE